MLKQLPGYPLRTELEVTKPSVSLDVIPGLLARRIRPGGVAVTNVLPIAGLCWRDLIQGLAAPWAHAVVVQLEEYENRILVASDEPLQARHVSRALRRHLEAIGSDQASDLAVRTLTRPGRTTRRSPQEAAERAGSRRPASRDAPSGA